MRNKNKILSGILALSAIACVSLGIAFQSDDAVNASAVDSTMSVNTLGYLEWAEVEGATSYQVSASNYGTFTVTENRANVGDALTQAAKASADSAEVEFTVTANDNASTTYSCTHTVANYIDYGFSKTDFSEAKDSTGAVVGSNASIKTTDYAQGNAGTTGVYDAISKNSLFTFEWNTASTLGTSTSLNEWIYLFGKDDCTWEDTSHSNFVWALRLRQKTVRVFLNGTETHAKTAVGNNLCTNLGDIFTMSTAFTAGVQYKFSVGVFDTYGLGGTTKTGETIYVRIDDVTNQTLIKEGYMFVAESVLADPNGDADTSDAVDSNDYENATGFGICAHNANYEATVTTGNGYDATYGAPLYEAQMTLSLEGDIGVNMYADLNDVAALNTSVAEMHITPDGGETVEYTMPTAETDGAMAGLYKFSYAVAAREIDKTFTAQLVIPGGPMGKQVTYSVRKWIDTVQADSETYANDVAMANALENYCEAAVTYFDDQAAAPELDATVVDLSAYAAATTNWNNVVENVSISLITKAKTTLRVYFTAEELPTVKVAGAEVTPESVEYDGVTYYYVEVTDIAADKLDETYTFEFGEDNVSCSALTYAYNVLNDSDAKTVNLAKALYAYSQVANTYFGE